MKTNIKLRVTPEQSEAVQKICFANGITWSAGEDKISYTEAEYLFIEPTGIWFRGITDHDSGMETVGYSEVDADLFIRTNGTCEEDSLEECQFAKYGFEKPELKCEILKQIKGNSLIGCIYYAKGDVPVVWNSMGICTPSNKGHDLTPIKKPWYQTCKFPVLVWDEDNDLLALRTRVEHAASYLDICRPLTNSEIDQLKQDF